MSDHGDYEIIYDDDGNECGRGYPIRTFGRVEPKAPPLDHPAWGREPHLLIPKPGDLTDLIVARDLPG